MKVRNLGRIMIAKGIELDRDIQPGEATQVKPGFEQSERIVAMITTGAVETYDIVNIKSQGGSVAVQPGTPDPFAEFGRALPLPNHAVRQQKLSDELAAQEAVEAAQREEELRAEKLPGEDNAMTSQLLAEAEKQFTPEEPKVQETADEMTEFLRRNGGARLKYIEEMKDVDALKIIVQSAKTDKTKQAAETRLKNLVG